MAEAEKSLGTVRFGPFELSLETQELRKHGVPVNLYGQAIQILLVLTANPGKLVTREELQQKLWPGGNYGDPKHGLNAAVNKLREKLGDSATTPTYIETLPGRGYRFIVPVECGPGASSPEKSTDLHLVEAPDLLPPLSPDVKTEVIGEDASGHTRIWKGFPVWARLGIVAGLLCAVAAISYFAWKLSHEEQQELSPVPLNALPGIAFASSFSPDGRQIAFGWNRGKPDWGYEAFVQIIGTSQPMQLTHNSAYGSALPAWSPDGKQMAFRKYTNSEVEVVTMPALGGPEVILGKVCCGSMAGESFSYSPDGKDLAFKDFAPGTDQTAIYFLHLEDGKRTQVTSPPQDVEGDRYARFSPNGKQIAFVRALSDGVNQLSVVTVATREVRSVLTEFSIIWGIDWDEAGRDLIYSSNRSGINRLWRVPATGGTSRLIDVGDDAMAPIVSAQAHRLAYTRFRNDDNIWVMQLSEQHGRGGTQRPLISSTRHDSQPRFSPDDSKIAFTSDRSGASEVWVSSKDGTDVVQLTQMAAGSHTGTPSWSPDGKHIAFDSRLRGHGDIYVVALDGSKPRRLTDDGMDDSMPTWSADGNWIYYTATKKNDRQIWKIPWEGGQAVQVTRAGAGGILGFEGPDDALFYLGGDFRRWQNFRFWQKRLPAGEERPVSEIPELTGWNDWQATAKGIYFTVWVETPSSIEASPSLDQKYELRYFDIATRTITKIADLPIAMEANGPGGISVSHDGKTILYTQTDSVRAEIMVVDNFH